jgi:serine/threonine protein kinase
VKIADFGISKRILEESGSALHSIVGTRAYCAPEILGHVRRYQETSIYSSKVDMWSLGCVVFNISSQGKRAFSDFDLVRYCDGTLSFNSQKVPLRLGDSGKSFVKALLNVEPEQRPTAAEALRHHWLIVAGVPASKTMSVLQPKSQPINRQNYNSFLDSTLSMGPALDVDSITSTMQSITSIPIEVVVGPDDAARGTTSIVRTIQHGETISERTLERQAFPVEGTGKRTTQGLAREPSFLEPAKAAHWPDKLASRQRNLEATKSDIGCNSGQEIPQSGNLDMIEWFRENETKIQEKLKGGWTPLHLAAKDGQLEVVKWLQGQGADIYEKDNYGRTPLHVAARIEAFADAEEAINGKRRDDPAEASPLQTVSQTMELSTSRLLSPRSTQSTTSHSPDTNRYSMERPYVVIGIDFGTT